MKHRERLIEEGLFEPLSAEEIAKRNGILRQVQLGQKVDDIPEYIVFRADEPFNHVQYGPKIFPQNECMSAELIADKLYAWEAFFIAKYLSAKDKEQPPRSGKDLPPFEMYKICRQSEWDEWSARRNQLSFSDI